MKGLSRRDISYLNRLWLDWSDYLRDGRSTPGLYPQCWPETTLKKAVIPAPCRRSGVKKQKRLVTPHQPLSTRSRPNSRPLLQNLDDRSEYIHGIAIAQPIDIKRVIICLWLRRDTFQQASLLLGLTSSEIGKVKYRMLEAAQGVE